VRTGRKQLVAALPGILEDPDTDLSGPLRVLLAQLQWEMKQLEHQIQEIDAVVVRTSGQSEACQRLEAIPGIGPLTATAMRAGQLGGVREKQMLESALTASQVVNLRP
jgi:transposase